jgi:hypothetical protein
VSGPIALADLEVDADGRPIHGHLTIASYQWWTEQFEAAGFERVPDMEARLNPVIARFGLAMAWNLYVFRVPGTATPSDRLWPRQFLAAVEHQWRLDELQPDVHSYNAVTLSRGTQGWKDVQTELSSSGTPDVAGRSAGSAA